MKPADDYVAKFTKDVPRAKLIQAQDCMKINQFPDAKKDTFKVPADATLENYQKPIRKKNKIAAC